MRDFEELGLLKRGMLSQAHARPTAVKAAREGDEITGFMRRPNFPS